MSRNRVIKCIAALTCAQVLAILMHIFLDNRMPLIEESISRYVGKAWWSSVFLALGDFYVIYQLFRFYRQLDSAHKMPKLWWVFIILLDIGLAGLSLCPLGLFDADINSPGPITNCHEFCSRLMFVSMIAVVIGIAIVFWGKSKLTSAACITYLAYSCFFVGAHLADLPVYNSAFFIWENLFIYGYFFTLLTVPNVLRDNLDSTKPDTDSTISPQAS